MGNRRRWWDEDSDFWAYLGMGAGVYCVILMVVAVTVMVATGRA
jgi:hypothetical protein